MQDMRRLDSNFSNKENLERAIERIPLDTLPNLLANLIQIEDQTSRILAMSVPLDRKANWKVMVRPLGISILAQTSHLSCIRAAIDLGSNEGEAYWATHNSKLLIEYLSLIKTCLADNLLMFSQRILEAPSEIR